MLSDLRFALRSLARSRGFTLVTVLTLALGIGSAAAIFSVTDWILFRANKFPDDVFLIGGQRPDGGIDQSRMHLQLEAYIQQTNVVVEYAKSAYLTGNVVVEGQPVQTSWIGVSVNLFSLLGIQPLRGRGFVAGEDQVGSNQVVVVSHRFWQTHLGGRKDALGWKLVVGDAVCTVVGILAEGQQFPALFQGELYRPLAYRPDPKQPWNPNLFVLGRLRAGVTREQATAAFGTVKVDYPEWMRTHYSAERVVLASFAELNKGYRREIYWVLVGAVGLLYAIACLNASNLMLVRMLGRRRELSIRLALGGGRGRLVGLLAIECLALAVAGAVGAVFVTNWLFPLLLTAAGSSNAAPTLARWTINWRVTGLLAGLGLLTSAIIATIPALRVLRTDINSGLKDGGAALGESRALARLRGTLVILQVAFAIILLVGAGLMIRTLQRLQHVDVGIDPARRVRVMVGFPPDYPSGPEVRLARLREIQTEIGRVPGVRDAGFSWDFLLVGYTYTMHTFDQPDGTELKAGGGAMSVGFQEPAGLRLMRGRWLDSSSKAEVMVNEAFARARWPKQDPIGQWLRPKNVTITGGKTEWKGWQVVGVIGDVRSSLRDAANPFVLSPEYFSPEGMNCFVVRLNTDYTEAWAGNLRRRLYAFDGRIAVSEVAPLAQRQQGQIWAEKMANSMLKVLAGIAVLLTVVGIFSVLAYTVDRRMGEFGVRMALGATRRDLLELVLKRGLALTLVGIFLGVSGAVGLTRYLQSLLFETSATDPWVLAAVSAGLFVTAVLACLIPARRATKVDVAKLLRSE